MGTNTPNFNLYKPTVGETGWGASVDTNFDTIDSNMLSGGLPRSYLAGYGLAMSGSPTFVLSIAVGQASDVSNAGAITLSSAITKDLSGAWSVGSGNGGRGTGVAYSASTWYHVFVIKRTDTNVVDAFFDTSATAANIPSPYTLFRRLGSIKTDGSKNITGFVQDGDNFELDVAVLDINGTSSVSPVSRTLASVPTGVNVYVRLRGESDQTVIDNGVLWTDLSIADVAVSATAAPGVSVGWQRSWSEVLVRTNTSAQIRERNTENGRTVRAVTFGWVDRRGKDA